jgi:hypothetical protein
VARVDARRDNEPEWGERFRQAMWRTSNAPLRRGNEMGLLRNGPGAFSKTTHARALHCAVRFTARYHKDKDKTRCNLVNEQGNSTTSGLRARRTPTPARRSFIGSQEILNNT